MNKKGEDKGAFKSLIYFLSYIVLPVAIFLGVRFLVLHVPDNSQEFTKIRLKAEAKIDKAQNVADEENAWVLYREAIEKFKPPAGKNKGYEAFKAWCKEGINEKNEVETRELLRENKESLELVDKAFTKESFIFPVDYKRGNMGIEKALKLKSLRWLPGFLILAANMEARDGNYQKAAEGYLKCLYLGEGLAKCKNNLLVGCGNSITRQVLTQTGSFLLSYDCDEKVCRYLFDSMKKYHEGYPDFKELTEVDMVYDHYTFVNEIKKKTEPMIFNSREQRISENQFLKLLNSNVDSMKYPEALKKLEEIENSKPLLTLNFFSTLFSSDSRYKRNIKSRIYFNAYLLLAALRLYKAEKGRYPDNLSQLVPEYFEKLPQDYFSPDGKFSYKNRDGKILLYGCGYNMKNDGGKPNSKRIENKKEIREGDWVFVDGDVKEIKFY